MLALIVHHDKQPNLGKGALLVPLARWEDARIPLKILRDEAKKIGRAPEHYVTLVKIPENHKVTVIVGRPTLESSKIEFVELSKISNEDKEIIESSFKAFRNPTSTEFEVNWLARLVLGERLPTNSIKWTKDVRLLSKGNGNASTKRN